MIRTSSTTIPSGFHHSRAVGSTARGLTCARRIKLDWILILFNILSDADIIGMVDIVSFAHSLVIVRTKAVFVCLYSLVLSR